MSITTALEARRERFSDREAGFTLIELLVVVIIIGILAAIAIPIYLGVQNNAKEASTKSDLTNNKTAVVGWAIDNNGAIPTVAQFTSSNLAKYGYSLSTNTDTLTYAVSDATTSARWCITGKSKTTTQFYISSNKPVTTGACPTDNTTW